MNILEVTHYMPPHRGGIEEVARRLFDGLGARGHSMRWLASATPHARGSEGNLVRIGTYNGLEERLGMPYPLWSPAALPLMLREVRNADVVHVHDCLYQGSCLAALACKLLGKPLVLTQHVGKVSFGPWVDRAEEYAYRSVGRLMAQSSVQAVCYSPHVADYFGQLGGFPEFEMIENGLDDTRFSLSNAATRRVARRALDLDAERVLLFVGRLTPKKRIEIALEGSRRLRAEGAWLVVVGDGPEAWRLENEANILHVPGVDQERMPEMYGAADLLVLPSQGEGLPLSVQEAMMTGLPVAVSNDPAFTENLTGAPGVRFAANAAELETAMRRSLSDGASAPVRNYAMDRWSLERFVDRYEALFDRVTHRA